MISSSVCRNVDRQRAAAVRERTVALFDSDCIVVLVLVDIISESAHFGHHTAAHAGHRHYSNECVMIAPFQCRSRALATDTHNLVTNAHKAPANDTTPTINSLFVHRTHLRYSSTVTLAATALLWKLLARQVNRWCWCWRVSERTTSRLLICCGNE